MIIEPAQAVDSYVANEPAQQFYERLGFTSQSISRVLPL
jgi:ribosomal protein S18 acetylase RimI-like enzyme